MTQFWRLDTASQTLALGAPGGGVPEALYWGARLPEDEDLAALENASRMDLTGGMLDRLPPLSLCPLAGETFPGMAGLEVESPAGPVFPQLRLKHVDNHAARIVIECADDDLGVTWRCRIKAFEDTDVIVLSSEAEAPAQWRITWLSAPVLPAPQWAHEMIDYSGRWCGEFQPQATVWLRGARFRDNPTGRTDHAHFPALLATEPGTANTTGRAHAWHYGYSGGHRMIAEELPDGRRQVQFGHRRSSRSAPLFVTRTDRGLNGIAASFQNHIRRHVVRFPDPARPRPVHYNCWEAVYFRHSLEELTDIATRAAALGAERFVLDDGWFKGRNDDTTSLGDWIVDPRKWPQGLSPLIAHVHAQGMRFGLWLEPEMVNRDSDLYRRHPEWMLGPENQTPGRNQFVLDMRRDEVRDHLFDRISALLAEYAVDYVKWDHNRVLPLPDTAQADGLYDLLDRLRQAHPAVEIESCASGGGRIDFGILKRTHRVWLSDSNDALERLRIQHEAALFLPAEIMGSHVGPRVCHTSGRTLPMAFRAWVAAQRHMGFELDPREMSEEEEETLKRVTAWWKKNRRWLLSGTINRLDSADPVVTAEMTLSPDGDRFVVFAGQSEASAQSLPRPLRLAALEPDAHYALRLVNAADVSTFGRGPNPLRRGEALTASGAFWMNRGVSLPVGFPATMFVIEGQKV